MERLSSFSRMKVLTLEEMCQLPETRVDQRRLLPKYLGETERDEYAHESVEESEAWPDCSWLLLWVQAMFEVAGTSKAVGPRGQFPATSLGRGSVSQ